MSSHIHEAARAGDVDLVLRLLDEGKDPNGREDRTFMTPLQAVTYFDPQRVTSPAAPRAAATASLLVSRGADPLLTGCRQESAWAWAQWSAADDVAAVYRVWLARERREPGPLPTVLVDDEVVEDARRRLAELVPNEGVPSPEELRLWAARPDEAGLLLVSAGRGVTLVYDDGAFRGTARERPAVATQVTDHAEHVYRRLDLALGDVASVSGGRITARLQRRGPAAPELVMYASVRLHGTAFGSAEWCVLVQPTADGPDAISAVLQRNEDYVFEHDVSAPEVGREEPEYWRAVNAAVTDSWRQLTESLSRMLHPG